MSYSIHPYLLNLSELENSFRSGSQAWADALVGKFEHELKQNDEWFKSEIVGGSPSLAKALRELIMGSPSSTRHVFQYGYALELLCRHFGRKLENAGFVEYHSGWLEKVGGVSAVLGAGPPVAIPRSNDFPMIGHATPRDAIKILATEPTEGNDPEVEEAREVFRWWLEQAVKESKGLVLFEY